MKLTVSDFRLNNVFRTYKKIVHGDKSLVYALIFDLRQESSSVHYWSKYKYFRQIICGSVRDFA
jgi:hypothetical protein